MSQINMLRKRIADILSDAAARARCVDFVADHGMNNDKLRRQQPDSTVTPFIETRRTWKDEPLSETRQPIRVLCEDRVDTVAYTESGRRADVYSVCPQNGELHLMAYALSGKCVRRKSIDAWQWKTNCTASTATHANVWAVSLRTPSRE